MSQTKLAIFGGSSVISQELLPFQSMGEDEVQAASEVIRSGVLSAYIGAPGPGFMGGERVQKFEHDVSQYFGVKHALAVNSWTSGLIAAVGAIGLEPGDEVITTPWTMAATATAILHWNGIPVFADIDPNTFNICPTSVEQRITPRTRAILAVDIFGQSANMPALRAIADRHGLFLLSDTAQSPGAHVGSEFAGTLADIGGFSLNYHKHIPCGGGGVLITNNDRLAHRLSLIRNHAEVVVSSESPADLCNMLGYNFRMGEIEAAIASKQLLKLDDRIASRQRVAAELSDGLQSLRGVQTPHVADGASHVYYVYGLTLNIQELGVSRNQIVAALRAEGVPYLMSGYQNIHLLPLFRKKIAYGIQGFPWTSDYCSSKQVYAVGLCPIAEELHTHSFLGLNICMNELPSSDVALIIEAFHKVWSNLDNLKASD